MEVIRKIVEVEEGKVTLQLPATFTAKRVELIVLPSVDEEESARLQKISKLRGSFAKKSESTLERQLMELRNEWRNDT